MRNILNIIIICSFVTMSAHADMRQGSSSFGQSDYNEMTSSGWAVSPRYSSPIYEPFSNTVPSEQTEMTSSGVQKGGPRKAFGTPDDYGQGPSPIGDAVVPMMVLLGAYCAYRLVRRRKHVKELNS